MSQTPRSYDGAGNLTRFDRWDETTARLLTVRFVYNGANQIACIDADASGTCNGAELIWQYDAYGNLLSDGTTLYEYDAALRLKTVTAGGVTTTYQYNGDGDRVGQVVAEGGVVTTTAYLLDVGTPLTMVLSETTEVDDGVNPPTSETITYLHGLGLVAQTDGASVEYFAYDGLGSVRQVVDTAGAPLMSQTFDPYGNPFASAGPGSSSFGYAGEQTDDNGLVFLRARYYNPRQGRFMQMDPSRQEVNLYGYAAGNPILYTDPSGLSGRWPRFECPADTPDWLCLLMGGTPASAPPVLLTTYYPPTTPADSAAYIGLLALLACVSLVSNAPSLSTRETTLTGNEPMISRPPQHPFEGEDKGPDKEPGPLSPPRDREPRRTLYHGTDPSGAASILTNGINIAAGNPQVDFGQGFYTTDNIEQARNRGNGAIVIFEVSVNELLSLRHLEFTSPDNAWATFVLYHRTTPGVNHNYDWVEGPVARRWSARTGIVTVYQGYHQLSIHTEAARQLFQRSIVGITN